MTARCPLTRLYTLDALRGIAALCVVYWHWQHFFYVGDNPAALLITEQPFYALFKPLYDHGALAVQLFFSISGFVFFWLYSRSITERQTLPLKFALDRFSRLYPLHLLTFGLVAVLQVAYSTHHSSYFVYQTNDWYHALLNLFLAPAWGLEKDWSFNAPIWSVSVEVLLYGSFFLICLSSRWKWLLAFAAGALGLVLYPDSYKIGSGALCFYLGGMTYGLLELLRRHLASGRIVILTTSLCVCSWLYLSLVTEPAESYIIMCVCFPLTLAMTAAVGFHWPEVMRSGAWLGDISYSSYLLHFPLQIMFAIASDWMGFSRAVFYQEWTMLLFFAVLVPLSLLCHRFVERPAQRYIRQSMSAGRQRAPRAAQT